MLKYSLFLTLSPFWQSSEPYPLKRYFRHLPVTCLFLTSCVVRRSYLFSPYILLLSYSFIVILFRLRLNSVTYSIDFQQLTLHSNLLFIDSKTDVFLSAFCGRFLGEFGDQRCSPLEALWAGYSHTVERRC